MDNLEKLSRDEFDKIYREFTDSADKKSEFYIGIEKNVEDIRSMNIDETVRESLYAQVVNTIYFQKDLPKMDGLNEFFKSLENLFLGISDFAEKVNNSNNKMREELYKAKWYQDETTEKLKETYENIGQIVEKNKKITKLNENTLKNFDKIKKDREGRDRIYDN